ncbi:MAG TPA: PBP1A family penicillin-binding protein [Clostridiales bacterium]|nr:PBP1A family penicillin-binding protein [Clostridiales bacterium]
MTDSSKNSRVNRKRGKGAGKNKKGLAILKKIFAVIGILGALSVLAVTIYLFTIIGTLDDFDPEKLVDYEQTSLVYDRNDNLISSIHGIENRIYVPLSNIPKHVQNAFIAVEDVRFRKHPGFDIRRMFGSLLQNIKARDIVAGAGTITQQVIRNTVLSQEQTIDRKVKEILLAWQLEQKYSKDQILEMYLNIIYFAKGAYGIEAAAKTYFGKTASELTVAEGALLAGIIKNPHRNSPFIDKERALERKNLSIDLMVKNGYLTEEEGEAAKKEEIKFAEDVKPAYTHGYFMDMVLEEAAALLKIKPEELYTGGYRIYTTMDNDLQEYIEELYSQDDLFPKSPVSGETCESALVIMDNNTGEVRAVLGGRSYPEGERYVLNRAETRRQPGSAIKPLVVYSPAIEVFNYTPVSFIKDEPVTFGKYTPRNAGGKFYGDVTLRMALAKSINIPAVKILNEIGIDTGISLAEKLGIPFTESDRNNLAVALGGMEKGVTPLELARAYATLGNRGSYKDYTTIRRIEDSFGKTLYEYKPSKKQVISEETAFLVSNILQSAASKGGTASRLAGMKLAAKTGTVQLPDTGEFANIDGTNDAWIAAYNPEYTVVVWMGFDRRTRENYLPPGASGGSFPAEIAKQVFEYLYRNKDTPNFQKPLGVNEVKLDGKALWEHNRVLLASALTPDDYVVKEYFKQGTEPTEQTDYWVVPNAPYNFSVTLNDDEKPVISFTPSNTFAAYNIMRTAGEQGSPILVQQIRTGALDPVEWTDTQVNPGETYGYFIVPIHPEMKLEGEPVQGPQTSVIYIDIPAPQIPDNDIWDNILDWLLPGNNQEDENNEGGQDSGD